MNETLYNGIELPENWPPSDLDPESDEPMPVPYLQRPPAVIPIDLGRQLFVDDFLIAETTLQRVFHKPQPHPANPVLSATTVHETQVEPRVGLQHGGLFFHPEKQRFELFYQSGKQDPRHRHMAVSRDLVNWQRTDFGAGEGNRFREPGPLGEALSPDMPGRVFSVWLDLDAEDPQARYKLLSYNRSEPRTHTLHTSPDGVHWSKPVWAGPAGDAQSLFYNPFRKVWVYSIKRQAERDGQHLRARWYAEHPEFIKGGDWCLGTRWVDSQAARRW